MSLPLSPRHEASEPCDRWAALLAAQTQLLSNLLELANQQIACIRRSDAEGLRELLAAQQRLANRLAATAVELRDLAAGQATDALRPSQRQAYRQQRAIVAGLYEQWLEREQLAEQLLSERRTQAAERARAAAHWPDRPVEHAPGPDDRCGSRLDLSSLA